MADTAASIGVISEQEIEELNASYSAELMNRIPGVNIVQLGSSGEGINGYNNGCIRITEDWVIEADLLIREELLKHGYKVSKPAPIACAIENPDIFVVNYNGDLYKCPPLIGADQFIAGNVKTGPTDYNKTYNVGFWENDKCLNCEYLPMCFGGCRYYSYLRNGNTCHVDCHKDYLDATLGKHIKMDLKYGNI